MTECHFNPRLKALVAILMAGMVVLLDGMAVSPGLHELAHKDAGQASHQCAVTLFAHGQVDTATVEVFVSAPAVTIELVPQIIFSAFSPAIENLPAGRAPPVSVAFLV